MVTIDTSGGRAVLDALTAETDQDIDHVLEANAFQFKYYTEHIDYLDQHSFRSLLRNPTRPSDRDILEALRSGFQRAMAQPEVLREQFDVLDALDTAEIEADVTRFLPSSVTFDTTVYATIDGFNGGFHYQGDIGLSVLDMEPGLYPSKLRHELHHVGVDNVIDSTSAFAETLESDTAVSDCLDLVLTLLKEGLAIYFAQGGLEYYERSPAGEDRIAAYRDKERALFEETEAVLRTLLDTDDSARRRELKRSLTLDEAGVLPPSHFVGARMIEIMAQVYAPDEIVASLDAPSRFLPLYQDAATHVGEYTFDDDLVEQVTGFKNTEQ